jgi:CRP-like cAMP-binding protein
MEQREAHAMSGEEIERALRRLERRTPLSEDAKAAVRALPYAYRTIDSGTYIVREGEPPVHCALLLTGFAYRHKVTGEGARQILSLHMAGEFLDLQNSFLAVADHNVQALTRAELAMIPVPALQRLANQQPDIARAMWIDTLIDSAIFREWMVNVGRRDSLSRVAHLLCEFSLRLDAAGLAHDGAYELPMTQEQLADATALTPVHINRVLKELGRRGLIERRKRAVAIIDWEGLRNLGDFSARYLHLEDGGATALAAAR